MRNEQEKVFIFAAFIDIRGSGAFRQRVTNEKRQSLPFWAKFDDLVDNFEIDHEYIIKHLGDGFLCTSRLNGKNGARCARLFNELLDFWHKADRLIRRSEPGPDGIKIHVSAGDAIQTILSNGEIVYHGYCLDLIGTSIKMDSFKAIPFVSHTSARDLMSHVEIERARFGFTQLPPPELRRTSEQVYTKDLNLMFEFQKR